MKKISLLLAGLLSIFLVACSNQKNADGKLNIVTTFYPVYEFTKQVAGDEANVELLIGAGTEPHDYEPSAKAVATIQDADAFVYENENMETWVPDLLINLTNKEETVIRATGNMVKRGIIMPMIPMFGYLRSGLLKWWSTFVTA